MLLPAVLATPGLLLITAILYRTFTLLYTYDKRLPGTRRPGQRTRVLIVLGSGGHTAEMLQMLRRIDTTRYTHRSYLVSSGDNFSARKAEEFELALSKQAGVSLEGTKIHGLVDAAGSYDVCIIPRARRVHQSLLSTPATALLCLWYCFNILHRPKTAPPDDTVVKGKLQHHGSYGYPDLLLTNGPGTGVIVVLAALLIRFAGLPGAEGKMRSIYVESWARVSRLSLSGKLLLRVVDRFIVQWEKLAVSTGGKAEYLGVLV